MARQCRELENAVKGSILAEPGKKIEADLLGISVFQYLHITRGTKHQENLKNG